MYVQNLEIMFYTHLFFTLLSKERKYLKFQNVHFIEVTRVLAVIR